MERTEGLVAKPEILSRWLIAGFVPQRRSKRNYGMNVKFVDEGNVSPQNDGENVVEMKCLPQTGDRIRLGDGTTVEVTGITHMLNETEFAALATIRRVL